MWLYMVVEICYMWQIAEAIIIERQSNYRQKWALMQFYKYIPVNDLCIHVAAYIALSCRSLKSVFAT